MEVFQGKGVCGGVAFGTAYPLIRQVKLIDDVCTGETETEWGRFLEAKSEVDRQLEEIYKKTEEELGEEEAAIIGVQRLILDDGDFVGMIEDRIRNERTGAAYAVAEAGREYTAFFASLDDAYMRARATDVNDVAQRLLGVLLGTRTGISFNHPVVVIADDLTPSEALQMDRSRIRAFVIRHGSSGSHTAILARVMGIPCIVQTDVPLTRDLAGRSVAVDGENGLCYLEPDVQALEELLEKHKHEKARREMLNSLRGLPTVTKSGRPVMLYSNIGCAEDVDAVIENDSEGIGLLRSEFLYLERDDYPGEDELFEVYRRVAEAMDGRRVIIRTLDIGADKKADYLKLDDEENPALGLRGVRVCLERPELFKTQLRAIYRASAYGNVAVMFPMIASIWEIRRCKELAAEARDLLAGRGVCMGAVEIGIMVETPAAVMTAPALAREVSFFSVGTNDLTQYTLAIDRQNGKLDRYIDTRHPAVMEMLRLVARAAQENDIWAGVCGDLAADPEVTELLVEMGYHELSVPPALTLELRKRIREME